MSPFILSPAQESQQTTNENIRGETWSLKKWRDCVTRSTALFEGPNCNIDNIMNCIIDYNKLIYKHGFKAQIWL